MVLERRVPWSDQDVPVLTRAFQLAAAEAGRELGGQSGSQLADRLSTLAVEALAVDGAGICVLVAPSMCVPVGVSDAAAAEAERVQFSTGEGPCLACLAADAPVVHDDLADTATSVWRTSPGYAAEVLARTPFRWVACHPFEVVEGFRGAVCLYRVAPATSTPATPTPGTPSPAPRDASPAPRVVPPAAVASIARVVGTTLRNAGVVRPDGSPDFHWMDSPVAEARGVAWVAEAMIARGAGVDAASALSLLRAHAFAHGRTVDEVAADLVAGRLEPSAVWRDSAR